MTAVHNRYFIIHKPVSMVSQFVSPHKVGLLGELEFNFPEGIHAVGRLDNLSEGLLILTTNKQITRLLFQSEIPHQRVYLVLVKNEVSVESLQKLRGGVPIKIQGGKEYITPPSEVVLVNHPEIYLPGTLKVNKPHTWLRISLSEGKYHQVRKMMAAIRHRVQRLIRISIEDLVLGDLKPGGVKEIEEGEFFSRLKLDEPSLIRGRGQAIPLHHVPGE